MPMSSASQAMPSVREDEESLLSGPQPPSPTSADPPARPILGSFQTLNQHRPSLRSALASTAAFMKPSFLRRAAPGAVSEKRPSYSQTEYLDGVRGVASLIVFILHWSHNSYPSVNSGWGYKYHSLWLLPFVRLIFSGAAMVSVFFVVSGFVLSHRFIQRMHRHEYPELFSGLVSITFRRALRLFLPAFASSLLAYLAACLGLYKVPTQIKGEPFEHGLSAYLDYLDKESNPFSWDPYFSGFYNPQLWSIAVEFRGSMVVFLLVAALAKSRTVVRLAVEAFLTAHCFGHRRWDVALFIAGMLLAELQLLLRKPQGPPARRRLVNALLVLTLALGVFLSGYPREHNTKTPGYMWTAYVWPFAAYRRRFWLGVASILIVGPLAFLPAAQAAFVTRPARYLGKISFALYLVHGLGNRTLGNWLIHLAWAYTGRATDFTFGLGFVIATALYFPLIVWISDMFWRGVDVPSTHFARWLERKCASREPSRDGPRLLG